MIIVVRDPRLGRKEKDDTSRKVETVVVVVVVVEV